MTDPKAAPQTFEARRSELVAKHGDIKGNALAALLPNDNVEGDWKAMPFSDDEAMICGPAYRHDPRRRMMVGTIRIDGLTHEEAQRNSLAAAHYLVHAVNELAVVKARLAALEAEHRWRDASKELPETYQFVLAHTPNSGSFTFVVASIESQFASLFFDAEGSPHAGVTHWAPIPAPPSPAAAPTRGTADPA